MIATVEQFLIWHRASVWRSPTVCRRWTRRASQPTRSVAELLASDILAIESGETLVLPLGVHPCELEAAK